MTTYLRLSLLCWLFFTIGCQSKEILEPPVVSVDPEINLLVREQLGPAPRTLELVATTLQTYPCLNYLLNYDVGRSGDFVSVAFKGIDDSAQCIDGNSNAETSIPLPYLPQGQHSLILKVDREVADTADLWIEDDQISWNDTLFNGFVAQPKYIRTLPEQLVWGIWLHAPDANRRRLFDRVLDTLTDIQYPIIPPGHYGHFAVTATNTPQLDVFAPASAYTGATGDTLTFAFRYLGDMNALAVSVDRFRQSLLESERLILFSTEGKEF